MPEYIPRRIGEILRPPVLLGAALGGVLSLLWLRRRALLGAVAGVLAVVVFAAFASVGLPINTRYAFLAAAILCIFCGAGVFGWTRLRARRPAAAPVDGRRRRSCSLRCSPTRPRSTAPRIANSTNSPASTASKTTCSRSSRTTPSTSRCGPVGVPNHAPIPLLALYLKTSPRNIVSPEAGHIDSGVYVDPASTEVEQDYVLDPHDPHEAVSVPPGFRESARQPLVADLPALHVMDRAPLVETRGTRRRSPPAAPVRELPLRLPVIA